MNHSKRRTTMINYPKLKKVLWYLPNWHNSHCNLETILTKENKNLIDFKNAWSMLSTIRSQTYHNEGEKL